MRKRRGMKEGMVPSLEVTEDCNAAAGARQHRCEGAAWCWVSVRVNVQVHV